MNLGEVLNKIPRPPVSLPQMPSIGSLGLGGGHKDLSQLGRAPLNMTQDDMQQLVEMVQQTILAPEDGAFAALWILTLIDHWNNEHERIVLLTERSFYVIRYDFIQRTVRESRRVGLGQLNSVITGPLVFPAKSLMPIRTSPGVQLMWGDPNEVKVTQKWNPLCRSLPYAILTHHPLLVKQSQLPYGQTTVPGCGYNNTTGHGALYDVNNFLTALKDACGQSSVEFRNSEIVIESYGNIGSMVFNQTSLGFTKETHVPPVV